MITVKIPKNQAVFRITAALLILLSACTYPGGEGEPTPTPTYDPYTNPPADVSGCPPVDLDTFMGWYYSQHPEEYPLQQNAQLNRYQEYLDGNPCPKVSLGAKLDWPSLQVSATCLAVPPDPVLSLCLKNESDQAVMVGMVYFAVPLLTKGLPMPRDEYPEGDDMMLLHDLVANGLFIIDDNMPQDDTSNGGADRRGYLVIIDDNHPPDPGKMQMLVEQAMMGLVVGKGPGGDWIIDDNMPAPDGEHPSEPGMDFLMMLADQGRIILGMLGGEGGIKLNGLMLMDGTSPGYLTPNGLFIIDDNAPPPDSHPPDPGNDFFMRLADMGLYLPNVLPAVNEMMPMSGEGGLPPGLYLWGSINLLALGMPESLGPGEEGCIMFDPGIIAQALGHNDQPQYDTEMLALSLTGEGGGQGVVLWLPGEEDGDAGFEPVFVPSLDIPQACTPTPTNTLAPAWTPTPTPKPTDCGKDETGAPKCP